LSSLAAPSRTFRDYSPGELIADGAVHAAAIVAGVIGRAARRSGFRRSSPKGESYSDVILRLVELEALGRR
jgi:hypothetical protein